jgi:hypothetical protein
MRTLSARKARDEVFSDKPGMSIEKALWHDQHQDSRYLQIRAEHRSDQSCKFLITKNTSNTF